MKTTSVLFVLILMALTGTITAQKTAFEYLKNVPASPDSVCKCSQEIRQNYETSLSSLYDIVEEDISKRSRANEDYMSGNEERIKASMMKEITAKSGISQQELEAMSKKKKMTQEDKQALANKVLQQHNLSMDEVKNVKNMDENSRKAWAQAYGTEQMAMAQANKNNPYIKATNDKAMNQVALLQEQENVRNQLSSFETEIANRYATLQNTSGKEKLESDLQKLNNELRSITSIYECNECPAPPSEDIKHWNAVIRKIHDTKITYCKQNTLKMIAYLDWYKENLIKNIPVYDRAEEIQYQLTSSATNTQLNMPAKGIYSLQALAGYLSSKQKLFEFKNFDMQNFASEFMK